jgi:death-on-curing protein
LTRYLTSEEAIKINGEVLGGTSLLRDRGMLESAVSRPMASAFGEDAYPTTIEKAAALLHSLILNHPFVDGNKRTATVAVVYFLEQNGFCVTWEPPDALNFLLGVAQGQHNVPAIAAWLANNTEPMASA